MSERPAYDEGYEAHYGCAPDELAEGLRDNPYEKHSPDGIDWEEGFVDRYLGHPNMAEIGAED